MFRCHEVVLQTHVFLAGGHSCDLQSKRRTVSILSQYGLYANHKVPKGCLDTTVQGRSRPDLELKENE